MLFSEKRQGAFIKAGAFIRNSMVLRFEKLGYTGLFHSSVMFPLLFLCSGFFSKFASQDLQIYELKLFSRIGE